MTTENKFIKAQVYKIIYEQKNKNVNLRADIAKKKKKR